jgi:hypothetical protein
MPNSGNKYRQNFLAKVNLNNFSWSQYLLDTYGLRPEAYSLRLNQSYKF